MSIAAFVDGWKNAFSLKGFIQGCKLFNVLVNVAVCLPTGKSLLSYAKENFPFEEMARSEITPYVKIMAYPVAFHIELYLKQIQGSICGQGQAEAGSSQQQQYHLPYWCCH